MIQGEILIGSKSRNNDLSNWRGYLALYINRKLIEDSEASGNIKDICKTYAEKYSNLLKLNNIVDYKIVNGKRVRPKSKERLKCYPAPIIAEELFKESLEEKLFT